MISSEIIVKKSASVIWNALTDKEQMKVWYFDIPDFELKPGAVFNFFEPGGQNQFHHRCTVKKIEPNKLFSHTWTHPGHSQGESVVTWILEETDGNTKVIIQHEGLENFADAGEAFAPENYRIGWNGIIAALKNYVYGLRKHSYNSVINSTAEKVWNILWDDNAYRKWTSVFSEGSYYSGKLEQGGRIHFLSKGGDGMYADVIFCVPNSYMLFQHKGEVKKFEEQPLDDKTDEWSGSFESYSLKAADGKTILTAEVDLSPGAIKFFDDTFPKALAKIKVMAEGS